MNYRKIPDDTNHTLALQIQHEKRVRLSRVRPSVLFFTLTSTLLYSTLGAINAAESRQNLTSFLQFSTKLFQAFTLSNQRPPRMANRYFLEILLNPQMVSKYFFILV